MTGPTPHQTREGEYRLGSGVGLGINLIRRTRTVEVTEEELQANPLVRSWFEAIVRAGETADLERENLRRGRTR